MKNRGMVLITVLWIVLVIAFISFSLAAAARVELTASENSFDSDRAFFMAKTAADAIFQTAGTARESPEIGTFCPVFGSTS